MIKYIIFIIKNPIHPKIEMILLSYILTIRIIYTKQTFSYWHMSQSNDYVCIVQSKRCGRSVFSVFWTFAHCSLSKKEKVLNTSLRSCLQLTAKRPRFIDRTVFCLISFTQDKAQVYLDKVYRPSRVKYFCYNLSTKWVMVKAIFGFIFYLAV